MIHYGVVEDRLSDPLKLGRCKVRVVGVHSEDKSQLSTDDLPWAMIMQPTTSSANSGIGHSPTGIVEGTWVMVVFRDEYNQHPVVIGTLPGIPTAEEAQTTTSASSGGATTPSTQTPVSGGATTPSTQAPVSGGATTPSTQAPVTETPASGEAADQTALLTEEKLKKILPTCKKIPQWTKVLNQHLPRFGITSVEQVARFLAQCGHESGDFNTLQENLNYSAEGLLSTFSKYFKSMSAEERQTYAKNPERIANVVYASRMGNGNTASGEGWKYRGRGIIQLTGKANYIECSQFLYKDNTLVQTPDTVADLEVALLSAIWFWKSKKIEQISSYEAVTKKINGGNKGAADRNSRLENALKVLQQPSKVSTGGEIRSGDGSVITDGSGQPITSGATAPREAIRSGNISSADSAARPATVNNQETAKKGTSNTEQTNSFQRPSAMKLSESGFMALKENEQLSSLSPNTSDKPRLGSNSTPANTTVYSYLDPSNVWAIGWGSYTLFDNATIVSASTTLTKSQCDSLLLQQIQQKQEKVIKETITSPMTQSMFDACVSMVYNIGDESFKKTEFVKSVNTAKYEEAAALIPDTLIKNPVTKARREKEKTLFLKDGIPQDDGTVKNAAADQKTVADATQNPVVKRDERFDPVKTSADVTQLAEPGFSDPTKTFPKFLNEPDTHRLARHERIDGTIVYKKEIARAAGVETAAGGSWSQPPVPYNARYPYNRVYASESGHIQEFDDTPGNERVHTYHRSGTYTEIDCNGTQVNRIVGDSFQILERNGNVIIRGTCNITVEGDANIKAGSSINILASANLNIRADGDIGISAGGDLILNAEGAIRAQSSDEISLDGSAVHLNSGKGLATPNLQNSSGITFSTLSTPNRFEGIDSAYETPEDGTPPAEFREKQESTGFATINETPTVKSTTATQEPAVTPATEAPVTKQTTETIPVSCDVIFTESSWSPSYRLSTNFTLKDVIIGNGAQIPGAETTKGTNPQTIICNLKNLCVNVLEPIKKRYPNLTLTNSYRSDTHNTRAGGAAKSQHSFGEAADIVFSGFNRSQYYEAAKEISAMLPAYDQMILEYGNSMWIHVSFKAKGNRSQNLTADTRVKPKAKYTPGFQLLNY